MSGDEFLRFSRRLDAEWLREQLKQRVPPMSASAEATLLAELERAGPLGAAPRGWRPALRDALGTWPGRLVFASVACAFLLVGVFFGRATVGDRLVKGGISPTPVETPDYKPGQGRGLGIAGPVKPESERKFQAAMAFYGSADFAAKAFPALREAVTLDRANDQAQFWLGVTLLLTGKTAEAGPPLEEAVRLAPASVQYKQYLLAAYLRAGDLERALRVQAELMKRP